MVDLSIAMLNYQAGYVPFMGNFFCPCLRRWPSPQHHLWWRGTGLASPLPAGIIGKGTMGGEQKTMVLMYGLKDSWISLNPGWLKVGWYFLICSVNFVRNDWLGDDVATLDPLKMARRVKSSCVFSTQDHLNQVEDTKTLGLTRAKMDWILWNRFKNMFRLGIIFQTGCGTGKKSFTIQSFRSLVQHYTCNILP